MAWVYLFLAGLFEIGWAIGLKYTDGFSKPLPTVLTVGSMIISLGLLGLALNFSVIMSRQAAQITRLAQERAIERAREQGAREALEGQLDGADADAPAEPAAKSPQA